MAKILILVGVVAFLIAVWINIESDNDDYKAALAKLPKDQFWGPAEASKKPQDDSIRPFKISFSDEMIQDLEKRLKATRYNTPLEGVHFQYGFNSKALNTVVKYWRDEYKIKDREEHFNRFPQFKTNIQGLDVHFLHVKPATVKKSATVVPVLMMHGWPGSVREFDKILPLLTKPTDSDLVFEVIAPSLPGFGYSQAPARPGCGAAQMAVIMSNLMHRLGHKRYVVQGGDWGSVIGGHLSTLFPEEVIGFHTNFPMSYSFKSAIRLLIGSVWTSLNVEEKFAHRLYPLKEKLSYLLAETGYFHEQATKPDTIGSALEDSPAGLAAWILEKFYSSALKSLSGTNKDITKVFTYEELIDNLMMYWVPQTATSSARIYAESYSNAHRALKLESIPIVVPVVASRFPNEILFFSESQLRIKYPNLVHISDPPRGGHFAAMEVPQLLANDIFFAVRKFLEFHAKNGQ